MKLTNVWRYFFVIDAVGVVPCVVLKKFPHMNFILSIWSFGTGESVLENQKKSCLFFRVESNGSVKIGDSSFSWDLYPDEYLLQNDRYQPVRWMAPESLRQTGFYSSKTDVVWHLHVIKNA